MFFGRSVVQLVIIVYASGQPCGYKIMWGRYYNNSYTLYEQLDVCTREPCYWSLLFCPYCFICFTLTHEFIKNLYLPVLYLPVCTCFFFDVMQYEYLYTYTKLIMVQTWLLRQFWLLFCTLLRPAALCMHHSVEKIIINNNNIILTAKKTLL